MKKIRKHVSLLAGLLSLLVSAGGCSPSGVPESGNAVSVDSQTNDDILADGALYTITSGLSLRVMEASYFGMMDGNYLQQMSYKGDLNQVWRAVKAGDGAYIFECMSTNRYMTLRKPDSNLSPVSVMPRDESNENQLWRLEATNNEYGEYRIVSAASGKPIELENNNKSEKTRIVQNERSEELGQLWRFTMVDDGKKALPKILPVDGAVEHSSTPEIVKYGDTYYAYIMAPGVSIKMSKDLVNWEFVTSAFPTSPALPFGWMEKEIPGGGIWAPGVYRIGDLYYLYYCVSTGGSQNSCIGVAVNTTLDHTSPDFKWVDKGMVIRSNSGDPYNCIDPNIIQDADGQPWLVFGSYWQGIFMRKIDPATGLLAKDDEQPRQVASRISVGSGAIEAPYMIKRGDYYYLFAAFGRMEDNYHMEVGRSASPFGPFVSRKGLAMMDGYGTPVTEGKEGISIPGHASVFLDDDGQYYLVSEYFRDGSPSLLLVGTMLWDEEGWPSTALSPGLLKK